jgi:hypothetical protein
VPMPVDRNPRATETKQIRVCCLSCTSVYAKPLEGPTGRTNPGCPNCGYLGWVLETDAPPRAEFA